MRKNTVEKLEALVKELNSTIAAIKLQDAVTVEQVRDRDIIEHIDTGVRFLVIHSHLGWVLLNPAALPYQDGWSETLIQAARSNESINYFPFKKVYL